MPRTSMAALIARTRLLITDTGTPVFSDDAVQDTLDRHRVEQRLVPLLPQPTFAPGGSLLYKDYYSNVRDWEDDVVLQDISYNTLAPSLSELTVGHWHFTTQPNGIAVRATGKTYDLYAAAADLLEAWASQVKLDFDFTDGRAQYTRQQKFSMLLELAQKYRGLGLVSTTKAAQSELASDFDAGPAVTYPTLGSTDGWY